MATRPRCGTENKQAVVDLCMKFIETPGTIQYGDQLDKSPIQPNKIQPHKRFILSLLHIQPNGKFNQRFLKDILLSVASKRGLWGLQMGGEGQG